MEKGTHAMLELLKFAKNAAIPAKYVLFDSWFSSPSTLHAVKELKYDVIAMVKKTPKVFFPYNGEDMSLISIYNKNKKRRGKSKYLLSVIVDVVKVIIIYISILPKTSLNCQARFWFAAKPFELETRGFPYIALLLCFLIIW